jgi:phage tail sheath protein FI
MNLDSFSVTTAVVHHIPTSADEDDAEVLLTDEAIALDDQLKSYFRGKIVTSLKARGIDVVADPDHDQTVLDAVTLVITDAGELVEASKRIALHLDAQQSGRNSSGLLAVVTGQIEGQEAIGVVKLERERGVRFEIDTVAGKHTVNLELLRNLTLTDKTKVYKTAILTAGDTGIAGVVADDQRGTHEGVQVATFFLSKFLGCKPEADAAVVTMQFVKAAYSSINNDVASPETKGRYQVALLASMQDKTADIRPLDFAANHIDQPDRPAFLRRVREAGIDPAKSLPKDLTMVKVNGFKMTFKSGMVLVGDLEDYRDRVKLPDENSPDKPVELHDTVAKLTGR